MAKLITLLVLCSLFSKAQDNSIDSLKQALKTAKHDTVLIITSMELGERIYISEPGTAKEIWNKVNEICESNLRNNFNTTKEKKIQKFYLKNLAESINNLGFLDQNQGNISLASERFLKSIDIYKRLLNETTNNVEKQNIKAGIAGSYNNLALVYNTLGNIPKALEFFDLSLKTFENVLKNSKDKEEVKAIKSEIANSLNNIGAINLNLGNVQKALELYHKALKIGEELGNKRNIANSFNNIGALYHGQGDIQNTLNYFEKSLKIRKEINDKAGISNSLSNIGSIYENKGDPYVKTSKEEAIKSGLLKALDYLFQALEIQQEINDKKGMGLTYSNLGFCYSEQKEYTKALDFYFKSLKIREEMNDKQGMAGTLNNLTKVFVKQKNLMKAKVFALKSLDVAKELGFPVYINWSAFLLKDIYKKLASSSGDKSYYKQAYEMYELEIQMRDSVNNTETRKAAIKKQFQYQYEKKAAADSVKNAEEQKVKNALLTAQQAQLKQEKTQRFALYGGLILVIAFSGFVFNRFKITQKQKVIIEKQKHEVDSAYEKLHEKNKEVMDSIHYAARIQRCLITNEKYIAKHLNGN